MTEHAPTTMRTATTTTTTITTAPPTAAAACRKLRGVETGTRRGAVRPGAIGRGSGHDKDDRHGEAAMKRQHCQSPPCFAWTLETDFFSGLINAPLVFA